MPRSGVEPQDSMRFVSYGTDGEVARDDVVTLSSCLARREI
jgi:hypothetical protein